MNYKKLSGIFFSAFALILPIVIFAADVTGDGSNSGKIVNPIQSSDIKSLISTVLNGALKIGMPVIVLAIIYSGFLFVSAQGNSEKLDTAKRSLMYTLIGAGILLGSWGIAQLITNTVNSL